MLLGAGVHAPAAGAVTRSEVAGLPPNAPALVLGAEGTAYDPPNNPPAWYPMAEAYDTGTATVPGRTTYAGFVTHYDLGTPGARARRHGVGLPTRHRGALQHSQRDLLVRERR